MIVDRSLVALSPLGDREVWSVELDEPGSVTSDKPGQHLLLSESGRLYIVGNQKILTYKLDPENPSRPATQVKGLSPKTVPSLNPGRAPAVGLDGSLFFVNNTAVYGLSPQLQELWKVSLADQSTSRVTVGPSGKFVYLVGKKSDKMGLIALDARTGEAKTKAFSIPLDWNVLHAPVVLRHDDDGSEIIYAGANSGNDGVFACFNNRRTIEKHETDELVLAGELPGLFSQPTAVRATNGAKGWRIYAVKYADKKGQLTSAGWLDDFPKSVQNIGEPFSLDAEPYLVNGGNLAADRDGNVLVWTGYEAIFVAFSPNPPALPPTTLGGAAKKAQLLFGTDGTLYAANVDDRALRAIVPSFTIPTRVTPEGVVKSASVVSSPTHLLVDGTAGDETSWTLSAQGHLLLGNGFTVKKRTLLTIKVPAHPAALRKAP